MKPLSLPVIGLPAALLFVSWFSGGLSLSQVPAPDPVSSPGPSRNVPPDQVQAYVSRVSSVLAISGRTMDPFGRNQDPNYRPPQMEVGRPDSEDVSQPQPAVALSEVISAIQVTTVIPGRQTFLVGDRSFRRGDRFPLRLASGAQINVEVVNVTASGIVFRDTAKGETAVLRLDGAPAGMQRAGGTNVPPGVTVPNPAAPLDLQPADPQSNPSSR